MGGLNFRRNKKGFYFTLDAVLAGTMLTLGFILLFTFYINEEQYTHIEYLAYDIADIYTNLKINDLNNAYIDQLINAGNITDMNASILELIGEYYVKNATEYAYNLSMNVTEGLIPRDYGFGIYMDGEVIYERQRNITTTLISSKKMISGIEKGRPVRGATSRAYLRGIREKRTHQIAYFGGFVGQGNITTFLEKIPSDANITEMMLELDAEAEFMLYINNIMCNSSELSTIFIPTTGNMTSDLWEITRCKVSIIPGKNNIAINFTGTVNNAYVGGGYLKVTYKTSEFQEIFDSNIKRYYFPGIEGIINLYDSFYVPGKINNMTIYLHYLGIHTNTSNNTLYLTIGNRTIYTDDYSVSTVSLILNESDFNLSEKLNYSLLDNKTIPIRLGFWNLSYVSGLYSLADAVLITDVSGSMDWNFTFAGTSCPWSENCSAYRRNCDDPLMMDKTTRRIAVGKCLDKDFAQQVIDAEGARVGLVSYDTATRNGETVYLTRNITRINNTIGLEVPTTTGYTDHDSTCICCGLTTAKNMLITEILMTNLTWNSSSWNWTNNSFKGDPLPDPSGNLWYQRIYSNETQWATGNGVLGANFKSGIPISTNMGFNLSQKKFFDLWDMQIDNSTPATDFTSGLNTTANTFIGAMDNSTDDGWDWQQGTYGTDGTDMTFFYDPDSDSGGFTTDGSGRVEIEVGGTIGENADSGSFGVQFYIDNDTYDLIKGGNVLNLSFAYEAFDRDITEESVWLKARFGNGSDMNYLGYNLDSANATLVAPSDPTPEILFDYNPGPINLAYIKYPTAYDEIYLASLSVDENNGYSNDGNYITIYTIRTYSGNNDFRLRGFATENGTINGVRISCDMRARNHNNNQWGLEVSDNAGGAWSELIALSSNDPDWQTYSFPSAAGFRATRYRDGNAWTWADITNLRIGFKGRLVAGGGDDGNSRMQVDVCWITVNVTEPAAYGWHVDNLYGDFNKDLDWDYNKGIFWQDVSSYVTNPGWYYLDFGAKFNSSQGTQDANEGIIAYFDNISLNMIKDDTYYLRRHVNIANLSRINGALLSLLSDDRAEVYINGNLVINETESHNASYWNIYNRFIYGSVFRQGDNVIAVKLYNDKDDAKFNFRLIGTNNTRLKGMFLITDGEANQKCGMAGLDAKEEAIEVACKAYDNYGIITHTVGFGDAADEATLQAISNCSFGLYAKSSNTTELQDQFSSVVISFMQATLESQSVIYTGDLMKSTLYPDSYIDINYDSYVEPPNYNEISLNLETEKFKSCDSNVVLYSDLRIVDSKVSSFSGPHWTKEVQANGNISFNLSDFNSTFKMLGDPFMVNIPVNHLFGGNNSISIQTGDNITDFTNCSLNNSMFYTAMLDSAITYTQVLPFAEGCNWIVEYQDLTNYSLSVPQGYIGNKNCTFVFGNVSYNHNDTIDTAVYSLLNKLDFDEDNRTNINLDLNDLSIEAIWVPRVPYAWGPSIIEMRVWQ